VTKSCGGAAGLATLDPLDPLDHWQMRRTTMPSPLPEDELAFNFDPVPVASGSFTAGPRADGSAV